MKMQNGNQAVKAGAWYVIGNYLIKGLSFITVPIFIRLLSTTEYGQFNTYIAYESILSIFVGATLYSSFKNAFYHPKIEYNDYVSLCLLIALCNCLIITLVTNIVMCFANIGLDRFALNLLMIHSLASSIISYYNVHISINFEYKRFIKIAMFNVITNIVVSVFLILTILKMNRYIGKIIGTVVPLIIIAIFVYCKFWKKSKPKFNSYYVSYALKYSLPIIPHGLSQVILSQFDRIMIARMIGDAQAGVYSFAYNIYTIVVVTFTSLGNVWSPWFYSKMDTNDINVIKKASTKYAFGMFLFTVMVILSAKEIVYILGTSEYYDAIFSVIPLVIAGYSSFAYSLPVEIEYYYEKTKMIAMGTMLAALINIILNFLFINKYGYIAASYTTAITYFLYFIFHCILAQKIDKRQILDYPKLFLFVCLLIGVGGISIILSDYIVIRWGILLLVFLILLIYLNKMFNIIEKFAVTIRKKAKYNDRK